MLAPRTLCAAALAAAFLLSGRVAMAQSNAFTYSGRLSQQGLPASGLFDFKFTAWTSQTNGSQLAAPVTNNAVQVTNGNFTVMLDASAWRFDGSARWLEVGVRSNSSTLNFVELGPRQTVGNAPQAVYAARAGEALMALRTSPEALLAGNGAGITNISGAAITRGSVTSAQLDPLADALYRNGVSNRLTVINVKDFGAVGDGSHDDTVAIANAWASFLTNGGTLYFPPGIYMDSGTHSNTAFAPREPYFRDGRLILGLGSAIWVYTGKSRLMYFYNSAPNIEGLEFRGNPNASNCIYITQIYGKTRLRNCFFYNWPNTTSGALLIDEADGLVLEGTTFTFCNIGLGCGYRCGNMQADLLTSGCDLAVAIGVPTESYPYLRESQNIELNLMALYGKAGVAVDGGATALTLRGYFWWCTNAVIIGQIPGISTNYAPVVSMAIEHSYFRGSAGLMPAVQLLAPMVSALTLTKCRFDSTSGSPPIIKSYVPAADKLDWAWRESIQTGQAAPVFEDSTGTKLFEVSQAQNRVMNRGTGFYNGRSLTSGGGTGYVLDVMDASLSGPVARFGVSQAQDTSFSRFVGGLVVAYDQRTGAPAVNVVNADFALTPPTTVTSPNAPGTPGTIRWDGDYVYICVGTNNWKRAALSSW